MATTAKRSTRPTARSKTPAVKKPAGGKSRVLSGKGVSPKPTAHASVGAKRAPRRSRAARPEEIKDSTLHLRLRAGLKDEAGAVLAAVGISIPEAIRVFLGRIVSERRFPFELEVPNATTQRAMVDARHLRGGYDTAEALFDDLDKGAR